MQNENIRNTIAFVVIALLFMVGYQQFVMGPQLRQRQEAQRAAAAKTDDRSAAVAAASDTGPAAAVYIKDRGQALGAAPRVKIQTPTLTGSLSLRGGRIDDLFLTRYRDTVEKDSPPVEMFRPEGMEHAYFAHFGWAGANIPGGVPGRDTLWRLTGGSVLTPTTPVTLTWDNQQGLRFTRVISIDDQYLFTVKDTVANLGTTAITLSPYSRIERQGVPDVRRDMILHEGAIGTFSKGKGFATEQHKYKDWLKKPTIDKETTGGWLGITDKYWLSALIPTQSEAVEAGFRVTEKQGVQVQAASLLGAAHVIQPGMQVTDTQRLFAGAKRNEILSGYEKSLGLPRFAYAIDWGILFFLTRPIFMVVEFFYGILGNFGLAILALTVVVKLIMFPLANKAYESLSKMRTLQPKMEEIKKKYGDDPAKQQQETMALYQREKINPLAGCIPILIQIPVFYALYKVLFVTIEMRHAPFFGWIKDLSARDPSNIWNLFGAIPWDPASAPVIGGLLAGALGLGVLAIVYGFTMWLQQSMNPPAPDPVQRQIFAFMPLVFTFIMAPFAAGLLVYWTWNNILSIIQQYVIMHRFKAENPIDNLIARLRAKAGA